jgi:hypothetical protein
VDINEWHWAPHKEDCGKLGRIPERDMIVCPYRPGDTVAVGIACLDCNGTGVEQIPCDLGDDACEFCEGTGHYTWSRTVVSARPVEVRMLNVPEAMDIGFTYRGALWPNGYCRIFWEECYGPGVAWAWLLEAEEED